MTRHEKIEITVPTSLLEDMDSFAKSDGISRSEIVSKAMNEYIIGRKNKNLRKQLKKGYEEMAAINMEWAENCLEADNQCQHDYEEKLSECE